MLSNDTKFFFFLRAYTNYVIGGHRCFLPFSVEYWEYTGGGRIRNWKL